MRWTPRARGRISALLDLLPMAFAAEAIEPVFDWGFPWTIDSFARPEIWAAASVGFALLWFEFRMIPRLWALSDSGLRAELAVTPMPAGEFLRRRLRGPMLRLLAPFYLLLPLRCAADLWGNERLMIARDLRLLAALDASLAAFAIVALLGQTAGLLTRLCPWPRERALRVAPNLARFVLALCASVAAAAASASPKAMRGREAAIFAALLGFAAGWIAVALRLAWDRAQAAYYLLEWEGRRIHDLDGVATPNQERRLEDQWLRLVLRFALICLFPLAMRFAGGVIETPDYWTQANRQYWNTGDHAKELPTLDEGIGLMPRNEKLLLERAQVIGFEQKNYRAGAAEYERIASNPSLRLAARQEAFDLEATCLRWARDYETAIRVYDRALRELRRPLRGASGHDDFEATGINLRYRRGHAWILVGKFEEARKEFEGLTKLSPTARFGLGLCYCLRGQGREAERIWAPLTERSVEPETKSYALGLIALNREREGDWQAAYDRANEAIRADDRSFHIYLWLAIAADHLGKRDEAKAAHARWMKYKQILRTWDLDELTLMLPEDLRPYMDALPGEESEK